MDHNFVIDNTTESMSCTLKLSEAGIVGAGGAAFPTHVKYQRRTPLLIVNVQDSEPGYLKDKVLFAAYPDTIAVAVELLRNVLGYETVIFAAKASDRDFLGHLDGRFDIRYTPSMYKMGEAKHLASWIIEKQIKTDERTQDYGVTVSCLETVFNVARALGEGLPVVDKFVQVYGDVQTTCNSRNILTIVLTKMPT